MEQKKYDVFISYSRNDYVDELKNVIPGNEVSKIKDALTEAGISYWFDEEGIYSGQNFVEKIVTNIDNAKIFLFLSSANSNKSPWTCKEIASADEFKKHIIPVRIDSTPYNKKVLFRIADLDYIDYYTNPEKGMEDMIKSIKTYLEELAHAERLRIEEKNKKQQQEREKEEELKRQKELNEKRKQEEQQQIVSEIRLSCTTLKNEEAKLELDRENLLLKAEQVKDEKERDNLKAMIMDSRPFRQLEDEPEEIESQYEPTEEDLKKWNWGAFVFTWVWGLHYRMYWALTVFILYAVSIALGVAGILILPLISVVFGLYGTRWGWKMGVWKNWDAFLQVKAKWDKIGKWSLPVVILLFIALVLLL